MNPYPIYTVDAFTDHVFGGNPAAVCPLETWLSTETMQQLANENNLSETAFFVKRSDGDYDIRWFTPELEIDLAGHPTLATAYVLFHELAYPTDEIRFHSKSGLLTVTRKGELMEMNFPARMPVACDIPAHLLEGFSIKPREVLRSRDYFLVYESEEEVLNAVPDFVELNQVETLGIIITAKGKEADFVSRFFVPNSVIGEDPVTGSAHATLIPYWANALQKDNLKALQLSKRRGDLWCGMQGDRVTIAGKAVLYMKGSYYIQ
ncbi:PhzF family phenazine biosynthesis protein [Sediminibacterium goheungense]|uniref:PhzF family phenazine biosynthesis protein n=1 Tax=Sediminibacterium goheungense TaxID=1086393 RepID=A0A4R6IMR1_9BACT|nr:PhzF family phenazine biosynthesis protein [Sediminibacterium goheungense]TDO23462.1 PhzF family phenazine biosynthesis protein [Sediminibacterium goheungense]TDO25065.1 PhzF family phenazine biosynthesis protein [Sediminibacterium goheungense]